MADLLLALGQDLDSPHLADTPRRAADALIELRARVDVDRLVDPAVPLDAVLAEATA